MNAYRIANAVAAVWHFLISGLMAWAAGTMFSTLGVREFQPWSWALLSAWFFLISYLAYVAWRYDE